MKGLTDRERILALEAQVAELTEELEGWRARAAEVAAHAAADTREFQAMEAMARHLRGKRAPGQVVRLLLYLMDHAGQVCRNETLLLAIRADEDTDLALVKVVLHYLRSALTGLGLPQAVITVWGVGYAMSPQAAAAIRERLGMAS